MQSAYSSDRSSGELEIPSGLATSGLATHHAADPLILTPQVINILKEYVEEFEQADTQLRKKILERAMGDIYRLRPGNSAFNKEEARMVFFRTMHVCIGLLIGIDCRKSESGSTTTILHLIARLSNSLGSGLQGMLFTMIRRGRSRSLPRNCPEVLLDLRHSWVHSRMQPPNYGRG